MLNIDKIYSLYYQAQAVLGHEGGLGVFWDASAYRLEISTGDILGLIALRIHADLNVNSGIGARNGNVEAHCLVFASSFLFYI